MDARDLYAPRYNIYINNKLIDESITTFVESVTVEDDADVFDKITLRISALQLTDSGNVNNLLESKMFNVSQLLRVDMGYGRTLKTVGAGEIVKVKPRFAREGITLEVVAYDPFFRLAQNKHTVGKNYKKMKISQIFEEVISRHPIAEFVNEIPPDIDIVKTETQTIGKSDYDFLKKIANAKGLDFFNEFNPKTQKFKLIIAPPNDDVEPDLEFIYYEHDDEPFKTLLDFFPEMNILGQVTDVQFHSFNRDTKQKIQTFIKTPSSETTGATDVKFKGPDAAKAFKGGTGTQVMFKSFGQHFDIITDRQFKNAKEAKIFAEMCLKSKLDGFITGTGSTIGVESLKARIIIKLSGLGEAYNGNYYVNRVTHVMSDGQNYISNIDVRKVVKLVI